MSWVLFTLENDIWSVDTCGSRCHQGFVPEESSPVQHSPAQEACQLGTRQGPLLSGVQEARLYILKALETFLKNLIRQVETHDIP